MIVFSLALNVLLLNIPFGYWREQTRKWSLYWFLSIHIPVALSIMLRYSWHIKTNWTIIVIFVLMFVAGQYTGKKFCIIKPLFIKLHCGT